MTAAGIVEGGCHPSLSAVTIDRRATSVELLFRRLMARVLSPRRSWKTRTTALGLLIPVSIVVLAVKAIEVLPELVSRIATSLVILAVWLAAAYAVAHVFAGDPVSVEVLRTEMAGLGRWLAMLFLGDS